MRWSNVVTITLLALLLFLRIFFVTIIESLYNPPPLWSVELFEISSYSILGVLIWTNRLSLSDFHITKLSIWIFIISGSLLRINFSYTTPIFWFISLSILWVLVKNQLILKQKLNEDYLWAFRGVFLGITISILFSYLLRTFGSQSPTSSSLNPSLVFGLGAFLHELSRAAVIEEMIFRGFLWGCFKNNGLTDKKILFLQALLFWVAHVNYYDNLFSLFVAVPVTSIILGLAAWRSRSITSSIILHATYNTMRFFV